MAFLLLISLFLSSSFLYLLFYYFTGLNPRKLNLPPGSYGLPFIGETLQIVLAYRSDPEPFTDKRVLRYGSLFKTHIFGEPTMFSADPEVNQFILQNEGKLFESSYPSSVSYLLGKYNMLFMKGRRHKRTHALVVNFTSCSKIRDNLLGDIDRIIQFNLDSWTDRVLLQDQVKKIIFSLSVKQAMGIDPGEWTENLRKQYLLLINGFVSLPLPFFFTTYGRAMKARTKITDALRLVVKERRKEVEEKKNNRKKDILGALLEGEGKSFDDEEMADVLLSLLVAGYEATATTITFLVKFLTETPLALAQLKKEHDEIRAKKTTIESLDWSDYKSMPFTQCVINESLRVANVVNGLFRRATDDVTIKGFTIPKGWKVYASFRAVHLDQDYYKEARTFNPWRWQNKTNKLETPSTAPSLGNTYTPFGGGPRLCPGYELARVEVSVFLHYLVTNFSWDAAVKDKVVYFPIPKILKGYPITVHRLRQASHQLKEDGRK